jgi:hypothetical protein
MHRRKLLARLDSCWSALCVWFVRRSPFPPDRSIRLLNRLVTTAGLPCPCPVRVRR